MKALSGYAEWFWLICTNIKDVENRDWPLPRVIANSLPLRIYIHASKTKAPIDQYNFITRTLTTAQYEEFRRVEWKKLRGRIIGEVTIVRQTKKIQLAESDHVDLGSQQKELEINAFLQSKWYFGLFGFWVKDGVLYDNPIPMRGMLGFWEVKL